MTDMSEFNNWKNNALFLQNRLDTHEQTLRLGGSTGPYRPRPWQKPNGTVKTTTFCNRAAVYLNRLNQINSPLLSSEHRSGANLIDVNHDSFWAHTMARNLLRESSRPHGEVVEVPRATAQELANNFINILAARSGTLKPDGTREHGHVAWVTPGFDPGHNDAPFITNIGNDVRIKPWHNSKTDMRYFAMVQRDPFPHTVMGNLGAHLESGQPASSEALWLKTKMDTAYRELQRDFVGPPSPTTQLINRTVFQPAYQQQTTSSPFFPGIHGHLCNLMGFHLNTLQR